MNPAAATSALSPANAKFFLPPTLGGQMKVALQIVNVPPAVAERQPVDVAAVDATYGAFVPAARAWHLHFTEKNDSLFYPFGTAGFAAELKKKLAPQFESKLMDMQKLEPAGLVKEFVAEEMHSVPFNMMVGAGLLSGEVKSSFLDAVRLAAIEELSVNRDDTLKVIRNAMSMKKWGGLVAILSVLAFYAGLHLPNPAVLYFGIPAGGTLAVSAFIWMLGSANTRGFGSNLSNASTALAAVMPEISNSTE